MDMMIYYIIYIYIYRYSGWMDEQNIGKLDFCETATPKDIDLPLFWAVFTAMEGPPKARS